MPRTANSELIPGVNRFSRSSAYRSGLLFKRKKTTTAKPAAAAVAAVEKTIGGAKNGGKRVVARPRATRFYPAEDVAKALPNRKKARTATLRKSITPGTVLVLLAGRFRGKRVVFLKQLKSGLLLVTGPFKINGVPLRRVNQAYVLATSTKVDLTGVTVADKFDDAYFKRPAGARGKKGEAEFFAKHEEKTQIEASRVADQKETDKLILAAIKKQDPLLKAYLNSNFTLTRGQYPHALKF